MAILNWLNYLNTLQQFLCAKLNQNTKGVSCRDAFYFHKYWRKKSAFAHSVCVLCRETRRLLERLVYVSSHDFPVTVVHVASWYLLRHLHSKNDQELISVSIWPPHICTVIHVLIPHE